MRSNKKNKRKTSVTKVCSKENGLHMDIDKLFIPPKTLVFSATFQCTASCRNCCFGCNPNIKNRLTLDEMKKYTDQAIETYGNSLRVLVITGGEPFLLEDDLIQIIEYGTSKKLITRIVTNGYWATTYEKSHEMLSQLRNKGLKEINFSTGDDHQKWVPYDNIVNGCMAAMDLGLACLVNVEAHDGSIFKGDIFHKDSRLKPYFDITKYTDPLKIESGIWMPFAEDAVISYEEMETKYNLYKIGCTQLFSTLPINPFSQLMSCCGLVSERIVPFRLGDIRNNTIKELYEMQFRDLVKIWLFIEGPYSVLKYILDKRGIEKQIIGHICYVCAEIFKDAENIKYIKEHYKEIMPHVMFKYFLLKPTFS
jgi:hypothetical protein